MKAFQNQHPVPDGGDVFAQARRLVSARKVAELNGLRPNRSGFICCPLHQEKTASLKLYDDGSWHCFGCGKGGSSIDLAAALYGLDALGAVRRLNDDFRLGLPIHRRQTPQERREAARAAARRRELSDTARAFEAWRGAMLDKLTAVFSMARQALGDFRSPEDLTQGEALAIRWQAAAEYWADCLLSRDMAVRMDIFRYRREVDALCGQILNSTRRKSGAA